MSIPIKNNQKRAQYHRVLPPMNAVENLLQPRRTPPLPASTHCNTCFPSVPSPFLVSPLSQNLQDGRGGVLDHNIQLLAHSREEQQERTEEVEREGLGRERNQNLESEEERRGEKN